VVVGAGRWEPVRLGEDVIVLPQQVVDEGPVGVGVDGVGVRLGPLRMGRPKPSPKHPPSPPLKRHAEGVEIQQDSAEGA
jgi:hypothetical protein